MPEYRGKPPQELIDAKRLARMSSVDAMPPELRAVVHDYGLPVVRAISDLGVRKPAQIRHIVETVLNEFSPTRGSFAKQGPVPRRDAAALTEGPNT